MVDEEMVMPMPGARGEASRPDARTRMRGQEPGVTHRGFLPEEGPSTDCCGENCLSMTKDNAEQLCFNVSYTEVDP